MGKENKHVLIRIGRFFWLRHHITQSDEYAKTLEPLVDYLTSTGALNFDKAPKNIKVGEHDFLLRQRVSGHAFAANCVEAAHEDGFPGFRIKIRSSILQSGDIVIGTLPLIGAPELRSGVVFLGFAYSGMFYASSVNLSQYSFSTTASNLRHNFSSLDLRNRHHYAELYFLSAANSSPEEIILVGEQLTAGGSLSIYNKKPHFEDVGTNIAGIGGGRT